MLFAIGFGALGIVTSATGILVTVVFWTFGEMMLFPAMAAHLGDVAPDDAARSLHGCIQHGAQPRAHGRTVGGNPAARRRQGPVGVWSVMFGLGALAAALMVYAAPAPPGAPRASRRWILATIISIAIALWPPRGTITSA